MFDPRMLQDPILMALLAAVQGGQQVGATSSLQSNPDIYQENGVWKNRPIIPNMPAADPLTEALANKPFIMEGDYMSQQYYAELEAKQKARQMAMALAQEGRQKHADALELEKTKQAGETGRQELRSRGDIQKQTLASIGSIMNNENMELDKKVSAVQELIKSMGSGGATEPDLKQEAAALGDLLKKYNAITTPQGRAESLKQETKEGGGLMQAAGHTWDAVTGFYNQPGKLKEAAMIPAQGLSKLSTIGNQIGTSPLRDLAAAAKDEKFNVAGKSQDDAKLKLVTEIASKLVLLGKADGLSSVEIVALAKAKGIKDPMILDLISRM